MKAKYEIKRLAKGIQLEDDIKKWNKKMQKRWNCFA